MLRRRRGALLRSKEKVEQSLGARRVKRRQASSGGKRAEKDCGTPARPPARPGCHRFTSLSADLNQEVANAFPEYQFATAISSQSNSLIAEFATHCHRISQRHSSLGRGGRGSMFLRIPRPIGVIALVSTLFLAGASVSMPVDVARADDCLAAPNSPAPQGSHWYYRMDWAKQRKCWYLRAPGQPSQQAAAQVEPEAAPSASVPASSIAMPVAAPPVGAANSAAPGDGAPSLPRVKMLSVKRQPPPTISATTNEPLRRNAPEESAAPSVSPTIVPQDDASPTVSGRRRPRPPRCGPILRSRLPRPRRGIPSQFQTMPAMARFDVGRTLWSPRTRRTSGNTLRWPAQRCGSLRRRRRRKCSFLLRSGWRLPPFCLASS